MDYIYPWEIIASHSCDFNELLNHRKIVRVLCYQIITTIKYPYIQFMMIYDDNISGELMCPYVTNNKEIKSNIVSLISDILNKMNCEGHLVNENMIKGYIVSEDGAPYVFVNISDINTYFYNNDNYKACFVLTSEIINNESVGCMFINSTFSEFIRRQNIGLVAQNIKPIKYYMLPDVAYKKKETNTIKNIALFGSALEMSFGNIRAYSFYRSYNNILKLINKTNNKEGQYIIRFAVFVEGGIFVEVGEDWPESDDTCLIICYKDNHELKPDLLVKDRQHFAFMSAHSI